MKVTDSNLGERLKIGNAIWNLQEALQRTHRRKYPDQSLATQNIFPWSSSLGIQRDFQHKTLRGTIPKRMKGIALLLAYTHTHRCLTRFSLVPCVKSPLLHDSPSERDRWGTTVTRIALLHGTRWLESLIKLVPCK